MNTSPQRDFQLLFYYQHHYNHSLMWFQGLRNPELVIVCDDIGYDQCRICGSFLKPPCSCQSIWLKISANAPSHLRPRAVFMCPLLLLLPVSAVGRRLLPIWRQSKLLSIPLDPGLFLVSSHGPRGVKKTDSTWLDIIKCMFYTEHSLLSEWPKSNFLAHTYFLWKPEHHRLYWLYQNHRSPLICVIIR